MPREDKKKKFFKSKLFALVLVLIFVLTAFAYGRSYYQDYGVEQEISRLKEEVRNLEFKKMETLEILQYVQSPVFAEEKARMELNMAKPGEKIAVFSVTGEGYTEGGQTNEKDVKSNNHSNILKWWRYFMDGERQ